MTLTLAITFFMGACSGEKNGDDEKDTAYVTLSPSSLNLKVGQTAEVRADISMPDGWEYVGSFAWRTSNTGVATVSGNGNTATVTAVGVGTATITVAIEGAKDESISVTVWTEEENEEGNDDTKVDIPSLNSGFVLSASYISFSDLDSRFALSVLTADLTGEYDGVFFWESESPSVAMVDNSGVVTPVSNGETMVFVSTSDGETAFCLVVVDIKVKGIDADITADALVGRGLLMEGDITSSKDLYKGEDGTSVKLNATSENKMTVSSVGGDYSYAISLGGGGKQDYRNFEIETVGDATITVYVQSTNPGVDRTIAFYSVEDGVFTMEDSETAPGAAVAAVTFEASGAGTYYLLSTNSGIYIYEIVISYSSVCSHVYGPWHVTKTPSAAKAGKAERCCLECGAGQSISLPKLTSASYTTAGFDESHYTYYYVYEGVTIFFVAEKLSGDLDDYDPEKLYAVNFITNQDTIPAIVRYVYIYETVTAPILPGVTGQYFVGWYSDPSLTEEYDFSSPVTSDIILYAKYEAFESEITYVAGIYESVAVEWTDTSLDGVKIYYKKAGDKSYTKLSDVEAEWRSGDTFRVDILGLEGDTYYNVKIITSGNEQLAEYGVFVASYDRSGYAHYEYDSLTDTYGMYEAGVGAYTNEGTLKDGALVIYVTEENKNDVTDDVYKYDVEADSYEKVSLSELTPYLTMKVEENIENYGHEGAENPGVVTGIGEILNNRRYSGTDRKDVGIAALSAAYGAVAVRIVGEVTATLNSDGLTYDIVGLTDFNATTNGGSVGDNGSMARMVNAQSLTIEGVGEGAAVTGWGFHFISSATYAESGKTGVGFEVRNLTFSNYCEDAVGMEGEQVSKSTASDLSASVERCWVHNNTFLSGFCANPAESDKGEGDGSCDFKRGQYFTLSYNTFENCHKTNLIGSASTSLQYNITMHHNLWFNCQSRIPLVRNANVHFYNNYVYGDGKVSLSYVHSARANSYIFAENNYYQNCKNAQQTSSEGGGAIKAYGNTYLSCYGDMEGDEVEFRTQSVKNSCGFSARNIDYSCFDTDPSLFYYDEESERSDCYLTDSVTARQEVMQTAGAFSREKIVVDTNMSNYKDEVASDSVNSHIEEGVLDVDLSGISAGTLKNGIYFAEKSSESTVKGKGQIITFRLTMETEVHIENNGTSETNWGELVSADGRVYASHFASITVTLPAGTYFLTASTPDKDLTVTKLIFTAGISDDEKVQNVVDLIDAIGEVTLSQTSLSKINEAKAAYDALSSEQKDMVYNIAVLEEAISKYSALEISNVEDLISAIGDVGEGSGSLISAAREAYDSLSDEQKKEVSNVDVLLDAEETYDGIAVKVVNDAILALPALDGISSMSEVELETILSSYEEVVSLYENLSSEQKSGVTGYDVVTAGIEKINEALNLASFRSLLSSADENNVTKDEASAIVNAYNSLTSEQRSALSDDEKSKYEIILAAYNEALSGVTVIIFADPDKNTESDPDNPVLAGNRDDVIIENGKYDSKNDAVYNGESYSNALKIEKSTVVTISVPAGVDLTITICLMDSGKRIYYSTDSTNLKQNTASSGDDGLVTVTISAADNTGTLILSKY
ncbi:MAG: Ig-like domain-containing protein, partial [Clostridia bacterium]|nr:Ig-like domain-containing protein [Clostridia bacterium]